MNPIDAMVITIESMVIAIDARVIDSGAMAVVRPGSRLRPVPWAALRRRRVFPDRKNISDGCQRFTNSHTFDMTTEPSPTDEATRLTDPARTSPTAKMPGRDVAKGEEADTSPNPVIT
jgi:hypothetical protein